VNDFKGIENAATAKEARDAAGRAHPRGARAGDIQAAMMRYLAAEEYHEKVEETRAAEDADEDTSP
jgi:hypothetical protein